jgi:ABC-type Fe3+ transport system permease subunit
MPEALMEEFLYLKKSRRFWGWTLCLSAVTTILSPLLSLNAVLNILMSITERWEGEVPKHPIEVILDIVRNSMHALSVGATAMLISVIVFIVALILYLKRGKSLLRLTERALAALESETDETEIISAD